MIPGVMAAGAVRSGGPTPGGDPHWANVVSLLHFDGSDGQTSGFSDEKSVIWTGPGTSAVQLATSAAKFGPTGLLITGGNLRTPDSGSWDLGDGDFTIEGFVRPANLTQTGAIISQWHGSSGRAFVLYQVGANIQFSYSVNGGGQINAFSAPAGWSTSSHRHVAVSCVGGVIRGFVEGSQVGSNHARSAAIYNSARDIVIGDNHEGGTQFNGAIDDLRVTKGVGRYTSNFAPPPGPFPNS